MTREKIQATAIQLIAETLGCDEHEINRDNKLIDDLNVDSLEAVELVMELEDEFDITIEDAEAEKLQTVGEAIDALCLKLGMDPQTGEAPGTTPLLDDAEGDEA